MTIQPNEARPIVATSLNDPRDADLLARAVIEQTRREKNDLFLANFAANLPHLFEAPILTGLGRRLKGHAGFIVGSGPGLARNIDVLKANQDKGLIVAASSAVNPLLSAGVAPDLIVVVEALDTSDYLNIVPRPKCPLALASACHPAHFQAGGYDMLGYHLTNGLAFLFGDDEFIPHGGTAGSAGFTIGLLAGLNPLILVGQDNAFGPDRIHVQGAPEDDPAVSDLKTYSIPGVDGEPVLTHSAFFAAIHWYAQSVRHMREAYPDVVLVNASECGAHIPGLRDVRLEEVCHRPEIRNGNKPDIRVLTAALRPPDPKLFRENLDALLLMVRQLLAILASEPETGLELAAECRDRHPFLKEFLDGNPQPTVATLKLRLAAIEARLATMRKSG